MPLKNFGFTSFKILHLIFLISFKKSSLINLSSKLLRRCKSFSDSTGLIKVSQFLSLKTLFIASLNLFFLLIISLPIFWLFKLFSKYSLVEISFPSELTNSKLKSLIILIFLFLILNMLIFNNDVIINSKFFSHNIYLV